MFRSKITRIFYVLESVVMCLLLLACVSIQSADAKFDLRANEEWEMGFQFTISAAEAQANGLLISQALNESVGKIQSETTSAEWEQLEINEAGDIPYKIYVSGQGYESLNQDVFEGKTVLFLDEMSDPAQLHFQLDANELLGDALQSSFTLHGGRVLESNGTKTNNSTVLWVNPTGTMEAILREPSGIHWGSILFILVGTGVVGAGILQWRRSYQLPAPQPTHYFPPDVTPQSSSVYCGHCGTSIPAQARFCPNCGRERT